LKVGVFGFGEIYRRYASLLPKEQSVVVVIDNGVVGHREMVDGIAHINPREVFLYDIDLVILMSDSATEMREQLEGMGYDMSKVIHYRDYFGGLEQKREMYLANESEVQDKKSLLIISNALGFHGAPVTVLGMVKCAREMEYRVSVVASSGDQAFIDELNLAGASVIIQPWIEHASWDNLKWTNEYDDIIVNSLPVIICALTISMHRRTIVWLHESPDTYISLRFWWDNIQRGIEVGDIGLYAVSRRATENFRRFFNYSKDITILLPYVNEWNNKGKPAKTDVVIFAVIGSIIEQKGQRILLEAIHSLSIKQNIKFVFIGKENDSLNSKRIVDNISNESCCEYVGEMTREEMSNLYQDIDVVIVPSLEETLSLAAVEAMMMEKVCIVSDHCGIAEYITNGENGFVFPLNENKALVKAIEWCVANKEKFMEIGKRARMTYEDNFSLKVFRDSFKEILE